MPRSDPFIPMSPGADPAAWSRDPRDPDRTKHPGRTLLMEAALANDPLAVAALLPVSNPGAEDNQGRTALIHAAESPVPGAASLTLLLPHSDPRHRWASGMTALMSATMNGDLAKVNRLWDVSDVRAVSDHGYTLLTLAVWTPGTLEVLQRVASVCDSRAVTDDGKNVLHHAHSQPRMLAWLLNQQMGSPHGVDEDGRTPLMHTVIMGTPETVGLLLPMSDVLARDRKGKTALEIAVDANKWLNARPLALAMPPALVYPVVQGRRGPSPRSLERRVIEAEQAALRAVLNEVQATSGEIAPSRARARI